MKKSFTYKQSFSPWIFLAPLLLGGGAVYFEMNQMGVGYRRMRNLLPYPYSVYVFGGLALLLLLYAFKQLNSYRASQSNGQAIEVTDTTLTFPQGKEVASFNFSDVSGLKVEDDTDDGESITIYAANKEHEFFEEFFASTAEYVEFKSLIERLGSKELQEG